MWIFLGIVAFIALLITVILLLPVSVIVKTDHNGELILRYKLLFKTFGENPDPNNPILKTLKDAAGVSRLDKENLKKSVEENNTIITISESFSLIVGLLKRLLALLKYCKIKTLKLNIVCAKGDAAETAIEYGECCALIAPLLSIVHSIMKVGRRAQDVNVTCDYEKSSGDFSLDLVIVVRFFRVLAAFLRASFDEAKRLAESEANHDKSQTKS